MENGDGKMAGLGCGALFSRFFFGEGRNDWLYIFFFFSLTLILFSEGLGLFDFVAVGGCLY